MRDSLISLLPPDRATMPGRRPDALLQIPMEPLAPATALTGIGAGVAMARERLLRRPTLLTVLLGAALVVVGAWIETRAGSAGAVDRALAGCFRLVIPLVTFALSVEAAGRGHLREGLWPIARYGLDRRDLALGVALVTLGASALLSAFFAVFSALVAHGPSSPPLVNDVVQCLWIGALTGLAYAAWFTFAGAFGKRGWARVLPLFADFLVGGSSSFVAALLPHGHAQNLLGGSGPMALSQPVSSALLPAMAVVLTLLLALRCKD